MYCAEIHLKETEAGVRRSKTVPGFVLPFFALILTNQIVAGTNMSVAALLLTSLCATGQNVCNYCILSENLSFYTYSSPARNLSKCILIADEFLVFYYLSHHSKKFTRQEVHPIFCHKRRLLVAPQSLILPSCSKKRKATRENCLGRCTSTLFESPSPYTATACLSCSLARSW